MNFTQMLEKAIGLGRNAIADKDGATLDALQDEVQALSQEIEKMFQEWDEPPAGVEEMVDKMDEAHFRAGESFLGVCELISEGLEQEDAEPLEEARQLLDKAVEQLKSAEKLVIETLNPPS